MLRKHSLTPLPADRRGLSLLPPGFSSIAGLVRALSTDRSRGRRVAAGLEEVAPSKLRAARWAAPQGACPPERDAAGRLHPCRRRDLPSGVAETFRTQ